MNEALKVKLRSLADCYEVSSFCDEDPSQFLRWYQPADGRGTVADVEVASFIAAMLAFGNRKQFIPKIRQILETSDRSLGSVTEWLKAGAFKKDFPSGPAKFYRFYSYDDMQIFFGELADILKKAGSLGEFFRTKMEEGGDTGGSPVREGSERPRSGLKRGGDFPLLYEIISQAFPESAIVPKGRTSANKRIHMFLRWMVRRNSPVDLGFWDWANPASLLIPLDVHVMQEAAKLGLIPEGATASRKTAELLTSALAEVFPGDPCRGDFALFGLGVDK
ncbi:MAG: TIGR02757 family protein [Treponema sp.]|nr:TIGR02757 family protein [Treponema sp.]MDY5758972.1 TIGR02757 family protein [Treponema sp.]MDY5817240.1 TIGR02757 family protein [Treponema sp.]